MRHLTHVQRHFPLALLATTIATLSTPVALAQTSTPRLEEVIVTAQKRAESLQDVPLSVAAVSGEKLNEAGIETLEDLTVHMPNIHFTETGFSTQVRVRGIGSDNSQGFEQSVGMYVDGIYHGRAQLFRTPMMDMERAEMLRGPQSTLFGKNSIAGALNLTTARPTDEFQGSASYSYEFEHNQQELNGVVSGPIAESLRGRLAVRTYTEDGYFENTHTGATEPSADESAYRLSLEWDATDNLAFFLKGERNEFETRGRPIELTMDEALTDGGANYAQTLAALGEPLIESNKDFKRQFDRDERSDNEINNLTFVVDYGFNDHTLTLVSGLLEFEYEEQCDCDDTASEILNLDLGETYEQFSQEIRIASPTDKRFDWIGGLFYQTWDQTFYDELLISETNLLPQTLSAFPGRGSLALMANSGLRRDFAQSSDSWAMFGRVTWHVTERLHLTFGARYTEEEKEASKRMDILDSIAGAPTENPVLAWVYMNAFVVESEQAILAFNPTEPLVYAGHNVQKTRNEEAFNPLVNVEFDLSDTMMSYFSYTTGFKAGGFDPRSNSVGNFAQRQSEASPTEPNPYQWFEFEEESATAYELGLKTSVGDGRGEVNVALYRTEYDDLQISQFDGGVGFNVGNAKETLVQGIELDGRWALTDSLTASYGFAWLDFEYKDFQNGNCYAGQTPDGIDINGDTIIDTCDYTGKRGVYTPEYTINLSLDYTHNIVNDINFVSFIDWQHVDGHNVHVNLDPKGEIDAYDMVGMRLGLDAERWAVALLGKNLLDEYVVSYSGNAPLSDSTFNTNTFYSVIRRPMTIALEGTIKF